MYKILSTKKLDPIITKIEIEAPHIAEKAKTGQFIVIVIDEKSERIPLTLADWDKKNGTITIIFQEIGFTTKQLAALKKGDFILHILGPLGNATDTENVGNVICIGGGVGIAEIYPVSRAFKEKNNNVTAIIGARSKDLIILEKEMKTTCDRLFIATDDGSYGEKGFVSDILRRIIEDKSTRINLVYAIGPVGMMQSISGLTRAFNIKTVVNLNPIMVDATGMCGACRVSVGGEIKFACVDGPEFNGHLVDFKQLANRLNLFKKEEHTIMDEQCKLSRRKDV